MRLSLLTALHPERSEHLDAAADSVDALRVATGSAHDVEWIVCQDGGPLLERPDVDPTHWVALPARAGISSCRNVALSRASGEWVLPLDADDVLDAAGTTAVCSAVEDLSIETTWVATNRLLLSGEKTAHWSDDPTQWKPGELADSWTAPFPFHPNSVFMRRDSLLSIQGWPAIPANEDLGVVLALSEISAGLFLPLTTLHYRRWAKQEVQGASYATAKELAFQQIEAVLNASRRSSRRTAIQAPEAGGAFGIMERNGSR